MTINAVAKSFHVHIYLLSALRPTLSITAPIKQIPTYALEKFNLILLLCCPVSDTPIVTAVLLLSATVSPAIVVITEAHS